MCYCLVMDANGTKTRAGGDKRGNSSDRRARRAHLLALHGDGQECGCAWCGATLNDGTVEADRIDAGASYRRENVIPACRACNLERSDSAAEDYLTRCKTPTRALRAIALARG